MSRRVPLSRASVVISELRRCSPQLRWDQLPHDACSDDAAIDAAMREAVDSYHAEGFSFDDLAGRWQSLSPSDLVMAARWAGSPQVFDFDTDLATELASTDAGSLPAAAVELPYPIQYVRCHNLGGYDGFLAWTDRDFGTGNDGYDPDMDSIGGASDLTEDLKRRFEHARRSYYDFLDYEEI